MIDSSEKSPSQLWEVIKTSVPAMVDLSAQTVMWMVEAIFIGHIGAAALGGVGFALQMVILIFTVLLTFVVGSSLIISRLLGAKDSWQANHVLGQSLMLGFILSILITFIFYYFAPAIFSLIEEAEPVARQYGALYLKTLSYFLPFIIVNFIAVGIIRGSGDTHFSMIINITIAALEFTLLPLMVYGQFGFPRLGVAGVAISAGMAHTIGFFITMTLLRSRKLKLYLSFREIFTPKWSTFKLLFKKGFPTTIEQLSWAFGLLVVTTYVARLGVIALATHQVLLRVQSFLSMLYQGFGFGTMVIIGKHVGALNHDLAEKAGLVAWRVIILLVLILAAIIPGFSQNIIMIFTSDRNVIALGSILMKVFAVVQIPKAMNIVFIGNLRGAGELNWLMWTTIIWVAVFEITANWAALFVFGFGLITVWVIHGLDEFSRFICNFLRFKGGKWKLRGNETYAGSESVL
ncbi:MATE family efflux transporter [candidate division KSB1 bacterium]